MTFSQLPERALFNIQSFCDEKDFSTLLRFTPFKKLHSKYLIFDPKHIVSSLSQLAERIGNYYKNKYPRPVSYTCYFPNSRELSFESTLTRYYPDLGRGIEDSRRPKTLSCYFDQILPWEYPDSYSESDSFRVRETAGFIMCFTTKMNVCKEVADPYCETVFNAFWKVFERWVPDQKAFQNEQKTISRNNKNLKPKLYRL